MFSEDSPSGRGITADEIELPDSPGTVLLNDTVAQLKDAEIAGVLLALIRDCGAFDLSPEEAAVVVADEIVELRFAHKHLRIQFHCNVLGDVEWPTVRDRLHDLPAETEWLVIVTGALSTRAKAEIDYANYRAGIHYIEISPRLRWRDAN